jgi:uncharacterized protein (DUF433 family)
LAHHEDDLLDCRRIGRIALSFVRRRAARPVARRCSRGSQTTGDVRECWLGHDVLRFGSARSAAAPKEPGACMRTKLLTDLCRGGDRGGYSLLMTFTRISVRADQMDGVPCIRGLRIPVSTVVGMIAEMTADEVVDAFPDLEFGDVQEALHFAAEAVRERELPLAG